MFRENLEFQDVRFLEFYRILYQIHVFYQHPKLGMGREAGVCSPQQPGGLSGILWMDQKQISAGLTCLSVELSPTAKAAWVSPARAASGY